MASPCVLWESFGGSAALLSACDGRGVNSVFEREERSSRSEGGACWSGADSWAEALATARAGYPDAVDACQVAASRACKLAGRDVLKARPVRSVVGGSPCVARAMMGAPDAMRRVVREPRKVAGVSLAWFGSACAMVDADELIQAGGRMVALVRLLEASGVPVRLLASFGSRDGREVAGFDVMVRDFGAPLNLARLAYWVAHPSALRRVFFAWLETVPGLRGRGFPGTYGVVPRSEYLDAVRARLGQGVHLVTVDDLGQDSDVLRMFEALASDR